MTALRCFPIFLSASLLVAAPGRADAPDNNPAVKAVTPEEFAAEQNSARHYTFELAWPDGLVDEAGMHIPAADELAYLNEKKLDATAYILLVLTNQSPPVGRVAPEVNPLGRYGFKKIVFKQKEDANPMTVVKEYHPPASATAFPIIPAPGAEPRGVRSGDPFPDLSGRPPDLRPGALPPRIRYLFSPDAAVLDASARLTAHLLSVPLPGAAPLWADQVEVRSGLWDALRGPDGWAEHAPTRRSVVEGHDGKSVTLEGRLIGDATDLAKLEEKLRALVSAGGGGAIHAPTFTELARLGPFVKYALSEPILLLQTADQAHDLVFIFADGRVIAVDDLKGLPALP